jgi:hypothetical protein
MLSLQIGELPALCGVVGKPVVGEDGSWNDVRSHLKSSTVGIASPRYASMVRADKASDQGGYLIGGGVQCEMAAIDDVDFGLWHVATI